ncbi:MAG: thioredoxin fold domain-containing protein [Gammaproteobacteria bacterium]|nr:thioredoxin fold domain-containing protein [Gammaproteobacteria bacterium]
MQKIITVFLMTLVLLMSAHAIEPGKVTGGAQYEVPSWFTESFLDIGEDVEEAGDEAKKVLLFFHLDGCPYCDAMLSQNFKNGDNQNFIKDNFSVIAVNIKGGREITMPDGDAMSEKDLAQKLGVKYTPTIVFLDKQGKQVFRTNGYRNPALFGHTLEYVAKDHSESQTLNQFVASKSAPSYQFATHSLLEKVTDFSNFSDPVAILFEDERCVGCSVVHEKLLNRDDVLEELEKFLFVRFDADSDEQIILFDGTKTTPKQLAKQHNLSYRPGFLLFDEGRKIIEIDNRLFSFHFNAVLSFVSGGHHKTYEDFNAYRNAYQAKLLEQGVDINMVD